MGPPPVGAARGEATKALLLLSGWQVCRLPAEDDSGGYTACTVVPFPPLSGPFPNSLFILFIHLKYNETNWVGAQAEIGPYGNMDKAPLGAVPRRDRRSPHRWQQPWEDQCEVTFRPQGRPARRLAPKIQRPPRRGWFHVAFRARAPGFSIGLLAYGECQGFPVLIPHKVS